MAEDIRNEEEIITAKAADAFGESQPEAASVQAEDVMAQLKAAQAQSEEYLSLAQRVQADFDNYRRRNVAACSEAYDNGRFAIIEQMLPVVDNLERALDAMRDESMREGISLVLKQLLGLMEKWGVETIDRCGEAFDPGLEHAVLRADGEEGEPNSVCAVLQKGYRIGNRVLRYAMVKVVAG
ncbi:MAG TPA: nucleotide exchange factor GrpE [Clostridia bacterium]|nr:nucleotide exchange factor GrpE [Clostridia bacterium]